MTNDRGRTSLFRGVPPRDPRSHQWIVGKEFRPNRHKAGDEKHPSADATAVMVVLVDENDGPYLPAVFCHREVGQSSVPALLTCGAVLRYESAFSAPDENCPGAATSRLGHRYYQLLPRSDPY